MSRRRRLLVFDAAVLLGLALAWHTGWITGPTSWQRATGWSKIPPELQRGPALPWPANAGPPPRLAWLGHAGMIVDWHGTRLLVDPNLSDRCALARRILERPIGPADLGPVAAVLITHAHYDHLDLPTLAALPAVGELLVPRGDEGELIGLRADAQIRGFLPGERHQVGALEVVAVAAAHNGGRNHPFPSRRAALGWIVRSGSAAIYFAGDTGASNDFAAIRESEHPLLAVLPIGAYSPSFPMRRYHLSPEDAVDAARRLGVVGVVPYHFGTFALALDRPSAALPRFARAAAATGLAWSMPDLARPAADEVGEE